MPRTPRHHGYNNADLSLIEADSVAQVIPGGSHTLFLLKDGRIFGCGSNMYGGLRLSKDIKEVLIPVELPALTKCLGLYDLHKKIEEMAVSNTVPNKNT